jgi:AraC-like DNA-binding protein
MRYAKSVGDRVSEYNSWSAMITRCYVPTSARYRRYGARGISVCPEWRGRGGFERFYAYIGRKPSPAHSIDRIDNDGNYEPGNVRWATAKEQSWNSSAPRFVSVNGESLPVSEVARRAGLSPTTITRRLTAGTTGEALLAPMPEAAKKASATTARRADRLLTLNGETLSLRALAKRSGVSASCLRKRIYELGLSPQEAVSRPNRQHVTPSQVEQIRAMFAGGAPLVTIAERLGLHPGTVGKIASGRRHRAPMEAK